MTSIAAASSAHAGQKALAIAVGDCREPDLANAATAFSDAISAQLETDALDPSQVLERLRPRVHASVEDVERQLVAADASFYDGRFEQALEGARAATEALVRMPPSDAVAAQLRVAGVLEGLALKSLNRKPEQLEAWRRVLRTSPAATLDRDLHSPAAISQFEQLKRELARAKKVPLNITSTPSGAAVFVDGVRVGVTPFKSPGFVPGTYRVVAVRDDKPSFVHEVTLASEAVDLPIDVGFESALRPQLPLCTSGGDSEALKLATRAGADQALVLRVDPSGWVSAVLFDVANGTRAREGGMKGADARKPRGFRDLASFVLTGQPAQLATATANAAGPAAATALEVRAPQSSSGFGVRRALPLVVAAAGVVAAGIGLGLFVAGGPQRAALSGALNEEGLVRDPSEAAAVSYLNQRVASNNALALGLGLGGAVVAVAGAALFFVMGPRDAPSPVALVTPAGTFVGVAGHF
ncbi:MAG: PEGA domain-containing protein [Myxococcaceae bacterium]|nr:PEGA domain-containing protein [Myxococcaceae bacterium]